MWLARLRKKFWNTWPPSSSLLCCRVTLWSNSTYSKYHRNPMKIFVLQGELHKYKRCWRLLKMISEITLFHPHSLQNDSIALRKFRCLLFTLHCTILPRFIEIDVRNRVIQVIDGSYWLNSFFLRLSYEQMESNASKLQEHCPRCSRNYVTTATIRF